VNRSQVNRRVTARRTAPVTARPVGTPNTDLRARIDPGTALPTGRRTRKAPRMTATQRDSRGQRSDWTRSPYYWTDPAWGRTVSS
jgi:hypothetical protein